MNILNKLRGGIQYKEMNPIEDEKNIDKTYFWGEWWMLFFVNMISGFAAAILGWSLMAAYADNFGPKIGLIMKVAAAATGTAAAYFATDYTVKKAVRKVVFDLLVGLRLVFSPAFRAKQTNKYDGFMRSMQVLEWIFALTVLISVNVFEYYQATMAKTPAASAIHQAETINVDSVRLKVQAQEDARIALVSSAIVSAQADINRINKEISRTINNVEAKNGNYVRLIKDGNGWAKGQLEAKKASATRQLEKDLMVAMENKQALEQQRTKDLSYSSSFIAKSDSTVLATNQKITAKNDAMVANVGSIIFMFSFILKLIAQAFGALRQIRWLGRNKLEDLNGDGVIDYRDADMAAKLEYQKKYNPDFQAG